MTRKTMTQERLISATMFKEDYTSTTDMFIIPSKQGRGKKAIIKINYIKANTLVNDSRLWKIFENDGRGSKVSEHFSFLEDISEKTIEIGNFENFENTLKQYIVLNGGNLGNAFESYIKYKFYNYDKFNVAQANEQSAQADIIYNNIRIQVKYSRFNNHRAEQYFKALKKLNK